MDENATQNLAAVFEQSLVERPAPPPLPTEWIEGSHKFYLAQTEQARDERLSQLRADGVEVLSCRQKYGAIWLIKTMAPR